jgi:hypothetical protein
MVSLRAKCLPQLEFCSLGRNGGGDSKRNDRRGGPRRSSREKETPRSDGVGPPNQFPGMQIPSQTKLQFCVSQPLSLARLRSRLNAQIAADGTLDVKA